MRVAGARSTGWLRLLLVMAVGGCDPEPDRVSLSLHLRAEDDAARPVAGTRFWVDGRAVGDSGDDGQLRATSSGRPGQSLSLTVACPPAYRTVQAERELKLRALQDGPALGLVARCQPLKRRAALIVSSSGAEGASLPVLVDGRPIGQLDPDGSAHVLLTTEPHSGLRVTLDTSAHAALQPQSPVRVFHVGDEDTILLFDQTFVRPRARSRRPRALAPPERPYRLH
jgi:hypothetical protein